MIFKEEIDKNRLTLIIDHEGEKESLQEFLDAGEIESDRSMYEFFEDILGNCEWEWIAPEEIVALTDAPILGRRAANSEGVEVVYGWMQYAVSSVLVELYDIGKAVFTCG